MKNRRFAPILLLLFLSLAGGCAATPTIVTNVALVNPAERLPPTSVVEAFPEPPNRPFREIAQLETMAGEEILSSVRLLEHMRARAAEIGADAIIADQRNETRKTVSTPLGASEVTVYRVLKGVAIRFE